jgi:hypothetical protein
MASKGLDFSRCSLSSRAEERRSDRSTAVGAWIPVAILYLFMGVALYEVLQSWANLEVKGDPFVSKESSLTESNLAI